MAVPFVRLGLFAADKVVDAHFHKINDDVFTPGRRKHGLKRLATPRKYNKYHSSPSRDLAFASGAGAGAAAEAGAGTGGSDPDHGYDGDDSTSSESEPDHRRHPHPASHPRSRRSRARSRSRRPSDAYGPRYARSVDRYYHPSYDYTRDPRYRPAPPSAAPYVAEGYVRDPRVQEQSYGREGERARVYEPPSWGDEESSRGGGEREGRERRDRPGLKKRSSSVGDLRDREGRWERDGRRDERRGGGRESGREKGEGKSGGRGITERLGEWKEKEGTLSLIAAGVMAGSAVLLHV